MAARREGGGSTSHRWLSWECGACWLGQGIALGAREGAVSAGRKEPWWELLTRQGVRGLGLGQPKHNPSTLAQEPGGACQDRTRVCPNSAAAGTVQHSPSDSAAMEAFSTKDLIPQCCKLSLRAHKETWALL